VFDDDVRHGDVGNEGAHPDLEDRGGAGDDSREGTLGDDQGSRRGPDDRADVDDVVRPGDHREAERR
jgi:hypothetical protein